MSAPPASRPEMKAVPGWAAALAVLACFAVDRVTKAWARSWLQEHGPVEILRYLWLTYAENTGIAFGRFQGGNTVFIFVGLALLAGLLYWRRRLASFGRLAEVGAILVIGGAVGNLYDRIAYGFVVDFVDLRVWPIFNVADSCITVGVGMLAWGTKDG